jgi:hypothetical protein
MEQLTMATLMRALGQMATDALESLKNEQARTRFALLLVRYSSMALLGALLSHHVITEDQKKRLFELALDPTVVSLVGTGAIVVLTGLKSLFTAQKETLTAAASGTPMTQTEVSKAAKEQAPALSTPTDQVPQLSPVTPTVPNEPKE